MNIVILKGNLTRDPECRYTASGAAVCDIGVAVNRVWKNEAGEEKEECSFFDCIGFGNLAENLGQYFRKGKPILIHGRLKQDTWDDAKTGQKRYKVKIIIEKFYFCGESNASQVAGKPEQGRPVTGSRQADKPKQDTTYPGGDDPDEIQVPF